MIPEEPTNEQENFVCKYWFDIITMNFFVLLKEETKRVNQLN